MTILELREKRAKAWEAAKAFLDSHRNEKGVLSAEDDALTAGWNRRSRIWGRRFPDWSVRKPLKGNCPSR